MAYFRHRRGGKSAVIAINFFFSITSHWNCASLNWWKPFWLRVYIFPPIESDSESRLPNQSANENLFSATLISIFYGESSWVTCYFWFQIIITISPEILRNASVWRSVHSRGKRTANLYSFGVTSSGLSWTYDGSIRDMCESSKTCDNKLEDDFRPAADILVDRISEDSSEGKLHIHHMLLCDHNSCH